ncbi:MAG TPA: thiamine pyrophosphate-binding protein [Candidatus Acidoferrales bacterium]|nr:thiamine pyrophosphate-binding protein [Candidatus Acidoferrales bacterium]
MADLTGGQVLARCLAAEGVGFVFGLPSPEIDPFLAALDEVGIRLVPFRHEAAGAHMAEGLYKTTGKVAVVIGNPGPGSANLISGVITARHEGVPLIAITSQHRMGIVYPSPPSTFQGQDQLDIYKPAVKWGAPIFAWERIAEVTRMAFREMWTGRPGPVQIEVPAPIMYATGSESAVRILAPNAYRPRLPEASAAQLSEAAALLASAKQVLVIAGSGADRAGASDAIIALVERLGCPVISTMSGRSVVPTDHPNWLYGIGAGGYLAKREADVVLVVGSRLGNLDLPFDKYWGDPGRQKVIQIDVDPRHIGVTRPLALGIVADARTTIERLLQSLDAGGVKAKPPEFLQRCRQAGASWWKEQMSVVDGWSGPGLHPVQVMRAIGKTFGRDAIYVTDGGFTSLWAHWFLPPTRANSYLNILELGMLGTGIPSAFGAKLGSPDRAVVCVTGDGAAGFHFMEMQSAAREGAKLVTIVFAEGAWTMEEPNEQMLYGKTFGTGMGTVRWDVVAQGLGCEGIYAERLDEVEAALKKAVANERPTVICVKTDRVANMSVAPEAAMRFAEVYQGPM